MGFKNVDWAYQLDLPMREKAVLVAVCFRAGDKTHTTIVGQQTLAAMTGASIDTVRRSLGSLTDAGIITRGRRHTSGGWRTSDETIVNVNTYTADSLVGAEQVREEEPYPATSNALTSNQQPPNQQLAVTYPADSRANEQTVLTDRVNRQGEQTVTRFDQFDEFYSIWPRKVNRPKAESAWKKAIKRTPAEEIISAAIAYRDNPKRPDKTFLQHPATWLNADGWNDDLPERYSSPSSQTPLERAQETQEAGARVAAARQAMFGIDRKELSA